MIAKFKKNVFLVIALLFIDILYTSSVFGKGWVCIVERSSSTELIVLLSTIELNETTEIIDGKSYSRLSIPGGGMTWEAGAPQLPCISESFAIPQGMTTSLTILNSQFKQYINYSICPAPEINFENNNESESTPIFTYHPKSEYYTKNVFFPSVLFNLGQEGIIRSERIGTVTFNPVQYNPQQKILRIYSLIRAAIRFSPAKDNLSKIVTRSLNQQFFRSLFQHILNPEVLNNSIGKSNRPQEPTNSKSLPARRVKIWIQKSGMYSLSVEQLRQSGIDLSLENPRTLSITNQDKEIPLAVEGEEDGKFDSQDRILFYGEAIHGDSSYYNPYTNRNIYWLTWGGTPGNRFKPVRSGVPVIPYASHFWKTIHLEEEAYSFPGLTDSATHISNKVMAEDVYWIALGTGHHIFIYPRIDNLDVNSDSVRIRVRLFGITPLSVSQNKNHRIQILLNDKEVGIADFPGVQEYIFSKSIPRSLANNGINTITIQNILTGANDQVNLDWVEVDYQKLYTADNNALSFSPSPEGKVTFNITNFSEVPDFVFDYNRGLSFIDFTTRQNNSTYSLLFGDTTQSSTIKNYIAVASSGLLAPDSLTLVTTPDLMGTGHQADYLIITHPSLSSSAQAFKERLDKSGKFPNGVFVVSTEEIYDLFNYGIKSPLAIKLFLTNVYKQWSVVPSFAALWGDASWGFDKNLPNKKYEDLVPSYGYPASDNWYVTLDGASDYLPDMYIGRIPVKNNTEGFSYLKKLQEYDKQELMLWHKNILFINGGFNSFEQYSFQSQARLLHENYSGKPPSAMNSIFVNRTSQSIGIDYSHRDEIIQIINNGTLLINSMGHGALNRYDIDYGEPQDLDNEGKYPFMIGMSCNTGGFADPFGSSLAENYLLIEGKGACAYFGTTGWGFIELDNSITDGLFKHLFQDREHHIGLSAAYGLFNLYQQWMPGLDNKSLIFQEVKNLLGQYTVIGDPSLELPIASAPDLAVSPQQIIPENELPTEQDSPLKIKTIIYNKGLYPSDSIKVRVTVERTGQIPILLGEIIRPPFALVDTLTFLWDYAGKLGEYTLKVEIDPENRIAEITKTNNTASKSITISETGIDLLKPLAYQRIAKDSIELMVSLPSTFPGSPAAIYCEIDTSPNFDRPFFQAGPLLEDTAANVIRTRLPYNNKSYLWRARSYNRDMDSFTRWMTSVFTYTTNSEPASWFQDIRSFSQRGLTNHLVTNDGLRLDNHKVVLRAASAGQFDGDYALIEIDDRPVTISGYDTTFQGTFYAQGFMVAAINPITAELLWAINFNTSLWTEHSEGMAQSIQALPVGTIVIAAVKFDGANKLTSSAIDAFHSIGSKSIDRLSVVGSFACIGSKGASVGSIKEQVLSRGEGRAQVTDSITVQYTDGSLVSPEISGSSKWKSLTWEGDFSNRETSFSIDLLGWNKNTNKWDTLRSGLKTNPPLDLSFISPMIYPRIKLRANFSSTDGKNSPELRAWQVDFENSPEYILNYHLVKVTPDTLYPGDPLVATATIKNIGGTSGDSLQCRFSLLDAQNHPVTVYPDISVSAIPSNVYRNVSITIPSILTAGPLKLLATINPDHIIPEISYRNNSGSIPLTIYSDTKAPELNVTFNGITIRNGDYINQQPEILAVITDNSATGVADTSQIKIFIDQQQVSLSQNPDIDIQYSEHTLNKTVRIRYTPLFKSGKHSLRIFVTDRAKNQGTFSIEFLVDDQFRILNVYNYPNPFSRETQFTYNLTQMAELVYIKIYTVAGRLIRTLDNAPGFAGFNSVYWDGSDEEGDRLANGTYFYRLVARNGSQQSSVTEKIVVMR